MNITLMQGDCLERMKEIPDGSVDMICADLPYGQSSNRWDTVIPFGLLWEQYSRIIKSKRVIAVFGCEPFSSSLRMSNISAYKYDWVWDKHSVNGFLNARKRPMKRHENISIFSYGTPIYFPQMETRGKPIDKGGYGKKLGNGDGCYGSYKNIKSRNNQYYPTDILSFSNAVQSGKVHPTQKPAPLLEYLIKTYTNDGETVLDNCMGSGSTGVACVNTNRNFIGIELDQGYFDIAKQRIEQTEGGSNIIVK